MFYYFDVAEIDKKTIKLERCCKCVGECYCATIDLNTNHTLNFGFCDNKNNYELSNNNTFKLDIAPDPISNIMQRYGFEQNTNLPTYEKDNDKVYVFRNILNVVKEFFSNLFRKTSSI